MYCYIIYLLHLTIALNRPLLYTNIGSFIGFDIINIQTKAQTITQVDMTRYLLFRYLISMKMSFDKIGPCPAHAIFVYNT